MAEVINRSTLRTLAGVRSYGRGEEYFASKRVRSLAEHEGTITAKVMGTYEYHVRLDISGDFLQYSCSCPIGRQGDFCKHCVAVGLARIAGRTIKNSKSPSKEEPVTMDEVKAYLAGQDKETLVDMLVRRAMEDEPLRRRLTIETAGGRAPGTTLAAYRDVLQGAIEVDEYVSYNEISDYSQGLDESVAMLEELLERGRPDEVIELCEYALELLEDAQSSVENSWDIDYYSEKIQELHHAACLKAKPDPIELAENLFHLGLSGALGTFRDASDTYADILGKKGLAAYRELAELEWRSIPALMSDEGWSSRHDRKRSNITHIMEGLAVQSGDVEELVEVKKRDLTSLYSFLQIAEICKEAGKHDQAIEWAEKGLGAFPGGLDSSLSEFLALEYHGCERHDEAMALVWADFEKSPDLARYQNLKKHADLIVEWPSWRKKALAFMRQGIAAQNRGGRASRWNPMSDNSRLVRIFLWENDVETAWLEAHKGGCADDLWMNIAVLRERDYPEDSLEVYKAEIDRLIRQKHNDSYVEAVELLRKVQGIMKRLGQESEFTRYLGSVRAAHKPKRNLMKLFDTEGWT